MSKEEPKVLKEEEIKKREADRKREELYGGYREDENRVRYWMRGELIKTFNAKNTEIVDDALFWTWFRKFRKDNFILPPWQPSSMAPAKRGEVVHWDYKAEKKGSYLSEWWTDSWYSRPLTWTGASADSTKLALAMTAVRTVIRVIDDSDPPMQVKWASKNVSYTDFTNNEIYINPKPIQDPDIKDGEGIDIATAFAMHEASHAAYTKPIWKQITEPEPVNPLAISSLMGNLIEDIRIERKTSGKFPGFSDYFVKGNGYLWDSNENKPPTAYGPDLQSKVNFAIGSVKWNEEAEKLWRATDGVELDWWKAWSDKYQEDESLPLRASITEAIAHLRIATEEERKKGEADGKGEGKAAGEMDEMSKKEEEMRKLARTASEFRKMIEKLLRDGGFKIMEYCPHPDPGEGLSSSEADEIERLVSEELHKEDVPVKMPNGSKFADVFVSKLMEDAESRASYIGKPDPNLARLKAALLFRQELPQYTNRLQREGNLDEEELWRWSAGDLRVFEEKVIAVHPKVQMSLLVDMSGSMIGSKLTTAQKLAQLFVWALKDMQNVNTKVFGHTANITAHYDCQVYRLWEPGDPMSRLGLIASGPHANNYDGFAIASVAKELMNRGEPDEQRVLIVLADGYPAGNGYGGPEGMRHVKLVDDWARKNGVEVIQIAIDSHLDSSRQSAMFKHWIPYTDSASLPRKLEALLAKLT